MWQLRYSSGADSYVYQDGSFNLGLPTGLALGTEGLRLAFEFLAPDEYSLSVVRRDGERFDLNSSVLFSNPDQEITQFRVFASGTTFDSSVDTSGDLYINSMTVVPEPSASLLGVLVGIGLLLRRKRP